jgi:hypothetical protein
MISKFEAENIALRYLATLEEEVGEPLGLIDSETIEESFGWVFFYNSKEYLNTGAFNAMLAGNAPFIINRKDGSLHKTGTDKPIRDYIIAFEKQWIS